MIRRSHKKSRQGCIECKRSRKKCDESRPACVNCTTAKKQCSYTRNASSQSPTDKDFLISTGPNHLAGCRSNHLSIPSHRTNTSPQTLTPTPLHAEPYVNLLHLELYQNLTSNLISFFGDEPPEDRWVPTVLRYTFSYPYLMYEQLAKHLSIKTPTKSNLYLTESTTLQSLALSSFNSSTPTVNQDNIIPAFLFSGVLGLHFFYDIFSSPSPDLEVFLDRLVQSIRLLRGVRIMVGDSLEVLRNSDVSFLIQDGQAPVVDRDDKVTHAFEDLCTRFSESHTLCAFESKVYCEAITGLIRVYNSQALDRASDGPPNARMVTAWPITISAEYTDFLSERKPEALVVMAYFSILLHSKRAFWAVGDAGRVLLTAIKEYLGEGWFEWLILPEGMILLP